MTFVLGLHSIVSNGCLCKRENSVFMDKRDGIAEGGGHAMSAQAPFKG